MNRRHSSLLPGADADSRTGYAARLVRRPRAPLPT
jgi:hypothetical protein